jgi:hypothetical protein
MHCRPPPAFCSTLGRRPGLQTFRLHAIHHPHRSVQCLILLQYVVAWVGPALMMKASSAARPFKGSGTPAGAFSTFAAVVMVRGFILGRLPFVGLLYFLFLCKGRHVLAAVPCVSTPATVSTSASWCISTSSTYEWDCTNDGHRKPCQLVRRRPVRVRVFYIYWHLLHRWRILHL